MLIGFGVVLMVAAPFYYRWGKKPSRDFEEWRMKIQMYRGVVAMVGIGIASVAIGLVLT
jgi:uncharacterized oligopeptide transporter (OPT) family protein